jgi:hypothetical protein
VTPSNTSVVVATLALLGSAGLLLVTVGMLLWAGFRRHSRLVRRAGFGALALVAGYAVVLVGVGLASPEQMLPPGGEKYFCEIDCHLAYSVTGFRKLGASPGEAGVLWAVTVRTRFDERTIASWRPREVPLSPGPRAVHLVSADQRRFEPIAVPGAALLNDSDRSVPLETELRPGESYQTRFYFELPDGVLPKALDLEDAEQWPNRLVIGHEQSPFHGRTLLALPGVESHG